MGIMAELRLSLCLVVLTYGAIEAAANETVRKGLNMLFEHGEYGT